MPGARISRVTHVLHPREDSWAKRPSRNPRISRLAPCPPQMSPMEKGRREKEKKCDVAPSGPVEELGIFHGIHWLGAF